MVAIPQTGPPLKRWQVAVAGVVMQMVLGTVYAWSVFKKPLMESHGWSNTEVGLAFTLAILFIGVSAAFGGKFVDRAGSRKVATIAAVLFSIGMLSAALADKFDSLWLLWLGYGVIGGTGNGLGYITPIAILVRWFPDRRGLITGLAVMGFGLGAALMGQTAPLMLLRLDASSTFFVFAGVFFVMLLLAAQKLNNPPAGWVAPVSTAQKATTAPAGPSCDLRTAIGSYQFYLLWLLLFINVTAGLTLISNLSPFAQKQLGISPGLAGTIILLSSLVNGFGRMGWAALSDKIGRKVTFLVILSTQVPVFLLLPHLTSFPLFTVACCYILSCFGGGFATMPAFAADTFGTRCMGEIYGKVLLAWGIAGIAGPMVMEAAQKRPCGYDGGLHVAAGLLVVGFLLALLYRRPSFSLAAAEPATSPEIAPKAADR